MNNQQQVSPEQLQANLIKANNVINSLLQKISNVEFQNSSLQVDLQDVSNYAQNLQQRIDQLEKQIVDMSKGSHPELPSAEDAKIN